MTSPTAAPPLWGLMAEFEGPNEVVEAARRVHEAGYKKVDAYSPYPIEELAEALGHHHSWLPLLVLLGGITGCSGCTVPCTSHCQESAKRPGALTRPPHFGQLGSPLIGPNGPPRPCPRQGRSPVRRGPARQKLRVYCIY